MNIFRTFPQDAVVEFTNLKDHVLNNRELIVCETPKIIRKLFEHKIKIHKLLCTEDFLTHIPDHYEGDVYVASDELLNSIAGFKVHYQVLALADKPKDHSLNDLDDKVFYLNGLSSAENIGSIARSLAGFDINSLIVDGKTCSPFVRRAIRVSMGNIFQLKVHHSKKLLHTLSFLKSQGYLVVGTANRPDAHNLTTFKLPEKVVFIIGSEGHGMDEETLALCDIFMKIPINSTVAHLNASHAATIFMYEASRQK